MTANDQTARFLDTLADSIDPVRFAARLGIVCDPWQVQALRSKEKRILLLCGRQTGKTTVSAIRCLWQALYEPNSLILLVSPTLRQSGEGFKRITAFYERLGRPLPTKQETALTLWFSNNSRIVSLPSSEHIRGFSADLVCVDEAAHCSDELFTAIMPVLAVTQGTAILSSTPWVPSGYMYRQWFEGGPEWLRIKTSSEDCPRIEKSFLGSEKQALGQFYSAEYCADWISAESCFFDRDEVLAAFTDEIEPLL